MSNRRKFLGSLFSTIPTSLLAQGKKQTVAAISFVSDDGKFVTVSVSGTKAAPSTRIAYWTIYWGDGGTLAGTGSIPFAIVMHEYLQSGIYNIRLDIRDSKGYSTFDEIQIMFVRGPIPIPSSSALYGPQASITCPLGAALIPAGSTTASRQALIDANPTGTSFCIASGLHTANGSNTPKSGDVFVGQYGAIIDGTGWVSADNTQAFFRAHLADIDSVTIKNLVLRNFPQRAIHTWYQFSDGWIMDYNEIYTGQCGISVPNSSYVRHNYIHDCNGPSSGGSIPNGAYIVSLAHDILFEDNRFSFCGETQKIIDITTNVTFRRNYIHNCLGPGIWYDGDNTGILVEDNILEDNATMGIMIEISGQSVIRRNTIRRSGDSGIFLSTSKDADVYSNILEDNFRSVNLFANCASVGGGAIGWDLANNSIHDNTIRVPNTVGVLVSAVSTSGPCSATYTDPAIKNNRFLNNAYYVPAAILGNPIWYNEAGKTWAQWQAIPQDPGSSLTSV